MRKISFYRTTLLLSFTIVLRKVHESVNLNLLVFPQERKVSGKLREKTRKRRPRKSITQVCIAFLNA